MSNWKCSNLSRSSPTHPPVLQIDVKTRRSNSLYGLDKVPQSISILLQRDVVAQKCPRYCYFSPQPRRFCRMSWKRGNPHHWMVSSILGDVLKRSVTWDIENFAPYWSGVNRVGGVARANSMEGDLCSLRLQQLLLENMTSCFERTAKGLSLSGICILISFGLCFAAQPLRECMVR